MPLVSLERLLTHASDNKYAVGAFVSMNTEIIQAAIVAAHPFRWDQPFDSFIDRHGPAFDALELVSNNVTRETREKTERVLKSQPGMGRTGSSDAHQVEVVGCYYTEFPGRIDTMADFVRAIRGKQGRPRYRRCDYLTSGPVGEEAD